MASALTCPLTPVITWLLLLPLQDVAKTPAPSLPPGGGQRPSSSQEQSDTTTVSPASMAALSSTGSSSRARGLSTGPLAAAALSAELAEKLRKRQSLQDASPP